MFSLRTLRKAAPAPVRICTQCLRSNSTATSPLRSPGQSDRETGPRRRKSKVIFSGIQPTGVPHLGNYLGALRQWVKLQNEADEDTTLLFSIVDLHAITMKQEPKQLVQWKKEMLASLMAVGLDWQRSIIFDQSAVKQHAELMWILSCGASMGYLSRMTQWKSKLALPDNASPLDPSPSNKAALKLGLFSYPVLQAADILLYKTTHVPVGEDQAQHLEFSREIATGFNHLYSSNSKQDPILRAPQTILSPAKRVMSLQTPTKKMSKSDADPKSRIMINDSREAIHKKIKSALTDSIEGISYDREKRPGVSNLIDLMYYMDESVASSPEELAKDLNGASMKALKEKVADTIDGAIRDVRERYDELMGGDPKNMINKARVGSERAENLAEVTMKGVREAVGLGWD